MSSHKNKSIRKKLEAKYGKSCMFRNAKIAERIEAMGGIKTYKKYIEEHRYKLKTIIQLEKQRTLHHLVHRSEGGKTSENNGAVVNALANAYIHSLPRAHEEIINNMLRDFKFRASTIEIGESLEIEAKEIKADDFDFTDFIELPAYNIDENVKERKKKFNRAKVKQETKKLIDDELEL